MIAGHYASAMVVRPYFRSSPFWLLLLAADVPEFLWLLLALLGIEPIHPDSVLDATFANIDVHMTYSHNLGPGIIQALVVFVLIRAWRSDTALALVCAGLSLWHVLCDLVVGFAHQFWDPSGAVISLNSYARFPVGAVMIELVYAAACLAWYFRAEAAAGRIVPRRSRIKLGVLFAGAILFWLPAAFFPLRAMLG